ncbi:MAG: Asp-tRNA(Asn)/Glu-tRNA(Gln) amidotransferase subunit GatA [Desulfobacterota bacterium]|nr:Asp-tRNA(Asn)/Glu-tRNA(Gln) amidotransferase subunit GatA [Thermodesulfobacteriota bacterium]
MGDNLAALTIHELHDLLVKRSISARDITESVLERIAAVEDRVHAYITVLADTARKQAAQADARIARGEATYLTGIPVALKDILCTKGIPTTCGSKMLANFVPPYDATVIEKLQQQGAVFIGKTSMDEFAMGSSNETSFFGPVHNPWDLSRVPGGSSGGSAAAVAADECIAALGTDTGGSIRQPAALCGVVGMKPTYGRVSRYGLIAFASSLDQIGPITKDVTDAALLLACISGHDDRDATSIDAPVPDYRSALIPHVRGMKIGIPTECFHEGLDPEIDAAVRMALEVLREQGAEIRDVSLPHTRYAVAVYYLIAPAEASSNLARYDGVAYGFRCDHPEDLQDMYERTRSEGFGSEVKRRIMLGTYALSAGYYDAYYKKASQVRTLIRRDFENAFAQCDLIITPTTPTPAFKLGEKLDDPLSMYLSDIFTIPANLAGLPGISLPCGFTASGLPIGLQIIGNVLQEETVLRCAYCYEQSTAWHTRKPLCV